jgi:NAD(P)H-dependent FMN reductase
MDRVRFDALSDGSMSENSMLKLQIIIASTRTGRSGHHVGAWFDEIARRHGGFEVELVDLADVDLPLFDEPKHPRLAEYEHAHTKAWSTIVQRADGYVFVTPEYDHLPPAALVNAIQHLVREWAYKPVGFVSYGGVSGGTRGAQVTKQLAVALKMMPIPEAVNIPFFARLLDREAGTFTPGEVQEKAADIMLDELRRWAGALRPLRTEKADSPE